MIGPTRRVRVFAFTAPIDMRKSYDTLGAVVANELGHDILEGDVFLFVGRTADRCKILFWDRGGFVVAYKRLERGRFRLPTIPPDAQSVALDPTALTMLLDGIDMKRVRRPELWKPRKCGVDVERGSTPIAKSDPTSMWHPAVTSKKS